MTRTTDTINQKWRSITVGFERGDGDFVILATFNNNDGHFNQADFILTVKGFLEECQEVNPDCVALEREDAPDYIEL